MPRNEVIEFKVTAEEKESIRSQAAHLKVPVSVFVRSCALREHLGSPVPYETEQDKANKAKVRKAVRNEEPYEVKIEPGTIEKAREAVENDPSNLNATLDEKGSAVKSTTDSAEDARQGWIRKREIQLQGRMSTRAAQIQARQDWDKR